MPNFNVHKYNNYKMRVNNGKKYYGNHNYSYHRNKTPAAPSYRAAYRGYHPYQTQNSWNKIDNSNQKKGNWLTGEYSVYRPLVKQEQQKETPQKSLEPTRKYPSANENLPAPEPTVMAPNPQVNDNVIKATKNTMVFDSAMGNMGEWVYPKLEIPYDPKKSAEMWSAFKSGKKYEDKTGKLFANLRNLGFIKDDPSIGKSKERKAKVKAFNAEAAVNTLYNNPDLLKCRFCGQVFNKSLQNEKIQHEDAHVQEKLKESKFKAEQDYIIRERPDVYKYFMERHRAETSATKMRRFYLTTHFWIDLSTVDVPVTGSECMDEEEKEPEVPMILTATPNAGHQCFKCLEIIDVKHFNEDDEKAKDGEGWYLVNTIVSEDEFAHPQCL